MMIAELTEQECLELLTTTTVGRVGFVADDRVLILPVNYVLDGRDVLIRTAPEGILSPLPDTPIAFEVDHHDDLAGSGWSVLLSTRASEIGAAEVATAPGAAHKHPWAGGDRSRALRLTPETISGRHVRRDRA
ncbi:pyridoxamine 5'-phosphate oxidase family protein [Microbacterium esteraromaticum]|uniref:pyridoxamine 5'-phosphate oxidase family protein n=1 Tax=Microbacterium esteraromaticum TaxID=57043 RepID=UPI001F49B9D1|nr:pyridoxamine 5'-phosphate oxidase family protein [Microbacterium esteraromaticum]